MSVSNHQRLDCLLNRLCRHKLEKTSKLRVSGLCEGNVTGEFRAQRASNAEMFPFDDVIMWLLVSKLFTQLYIYIYYRNILLRYT